MPINTDPHHIGRAWITPDGPVVAGQHGTWTLGYEVGAYGYDERARLKIAWRFASDWGTPQFTDPMRANYTTVRLETKCQLGSPMGRDQIVPVTMERIGREPNGLERGGRDGDARRIRPGFSALWRTHPLCQMADIKGSGLRGLPRGGVGFDLAGVVFEVVGVDREPVLGGVAAGFRVAAHL